jgi:predicted secreted acid phosphatase
MIMEVKCLQSIYSDKADIYRLNYEEKTDNYLIGKKIKSVNYKKLFVGDNLLKFKNYAKKGQEKGNTILLQITDNKFIYIGEMIKIITLKNDMINSYISPVGNSDVPYPYIIGKNYTYLILENKIIPNNILDLKKCIYSQYYKNPSIMEMSKKMTFSILVKRVMS